MRSHVKIGKKSFIASKLDKLSIEVSKNSNLKVPWIKPKETFNDRKTKTLNVS